MDEKNVGKVKNLHSKSDKSKKEAAAKRTDNGAEEFEEYIPADHAGDEEYTEPGDFEEYVDEDNNELEAEDEYDVEFEDAEEFEDDDEFDDDEYDDEFDDEYEDDELDEKKPGFGRQMKKKPIPRTNPAARGGNKRRRHKGQKSKNNYKALWITLGSAVAVIAVIYIGTAMFFNSHYLPNTTINGQNFSGKKAADVESYLKKQVSGYSLTVQEKDGQSDTISGDDISLKYEENSDIQKIMDDQSGFTWPAALFSHKSVKTTVAVAYDETQLDAKIQSLAAVTAEQVAPQSAAPKYDGSQFVVEPEQSGTAVNMDTLNEKVHKAISEFKTELDMEKSDCYAEPKYTSDSKEVKAACDSMNKYCGASITYTMAQPVVVDKTLISTWVTVDDSMNVTFNTDAVRAWLTDFGNTYDTVGESRTITTPTGKTAEVSGGTYGWSVDEDTEFEALTNSIKNGEVVSKEPAYIQTAASHAAPEWGNTYLEVDLTAQHMWYIVNGAIALETDVVTGVPIPEKITPTGVYDILEMKSPSVLIGEDSPVTGKPIYETEVDYWMRVTWTGIGFHDADWQTAFGGSLYSTGAGSHGCINMPVGQAASLYSMLSVGTPVIIHN